MIPATDHPTDDYLRRVFLERTGQEPEGLWRAPGRVNLIGEHTDYNDGFVLPIAIDRQSRVAGRARSDGVLRFWSLQQGSDPSVHRLGQLGPGSVNGWAAYVAGMAWALSESSALLRGPTDSDAGRVVPGVVEPGGGRFRGASAESTGGSGLPGSLREAEDGGSGPSRGSQGVLSSADLVIDSDVPLGAGLSSSAALEVSAGLALADLAGFQLEPIDLALVAQKAENDFVGVPCGIMDQMVSASAKPGHALLIDTRTLDIRHVPFEPDRWGAELIVIDTRTSHSLGDGEYAARRRGCEEAARLLGVTALRDVEADGLNSALNGLPENLVPLVRHVVTENQRVHEVASALEADDAEAAGRAMNASHESLRTDYAVSSPELDLAVDVARMTGALGARMTGAGFGGSAIALMPAGRVGALERETRIAFADKGMKEPAFFSVSPAAGCSRLWP